MNTEKAYAFFFENAGYSYDPKTETVDQGRARCASELVKAEQWATAEGYCYQWSIDPEIDSSNFSDEEPYALWQVVMMDSAGAVVQSLGGVCFGPGGEPWGNNYRRVCEAELALEQLKTVEG